MTSANSHHPAAQRRAAIIRRVILVVGLLSTLTGAAWLFVPLMGEKVAERLPMGLRASLWGTPTLVVPLENANPQSVGLWANLLGYVGIFLLSQYLFLRPRGTWRLKVTGEGRPLKWSIAAGALVAMLVSMGLIATVAQAGGGWLKMMERGPDNPSWLTVWGIMASLWIVWAILFWLYSRSLDRYTALTRLLRGLLAGSILETLIAAPVQALSKSPDECYCAKGSYTGLVFGVTGILWCFGPGVYWLYVRERERREVSGNG